MHPSSSSQVLLRDTKGGRTLLKILGEALHFAGLCEATCPDVPSEKNVSCILQLPAVAVQDVVLEPVIFRGVQWRTCQLLVPRVVIGLDVKG